MIYEDIIFNISHPEVIDFLNTKMINIRVKIRAKYRNDLSLKLKYFWRYKKIWVHFVGPMRVHQEGCTAPPYFEMDCIATPNIEHCTDHINLQCTSNEGCKIKFLIRLLMQSCFQVHNPSFQNVKNVRFVIQVLQRKAT